MTARDEPERLLTSMAEAEMAKLPVAAGARQVVGVHVSPRRAAVRRFLRYRLAIVGVVILLAIMLMAALAPLLTPWPPNWIDFQTGARQPPSAAHMLGTDVSGRDVWARVLYGARTSLIVGFGAVTLYLIIGTLLGLAAGFYGRFVDQGLMRFTDTIMAIPPLLLIIVFVAVLGPSIISVIVVIGLLGWPVTARLVRGQLLVLRESEFITAARVIGVPRSHDPVPPHAPEHPWTAHGRGDVRCRDRGPPGVQPELPGPGRPAAGGELGQPHHGGRQSGRPHDAAVAMGPGGDRDHHDRPGGQLHRRWPA